MAGPEPIFLLGVSQRSGTHYLYDLLVAHPDCRPALSRTSWEGSWEDQLVRFSGLLAEYADRVVASNRLNDPALRGLLLRHIGAGLLAVLAEIDGESSADDPRRPVTKTPLTENLQHFADLFGATPLIVLIRDPRATVASSLRTFGGPAERWLRTWRDGARRVAAYVDAHPEVVVARYEDLYADPVRELSRIFTGVGVDPGRYDFDAVTALPVRGSSELGGERHAINWEPMAPTEAFDPAARGKELAPDVLRRLRWLAAAEMTRFGYADPPDPPPIVEAAGQRIRDVGQGSAEWARLMADGVARLRARRWRQR